MPGSNIIEDFRNHNYICVETYKRDGTAVRTPVWFVTDGYSLFVRTYEDSGKVKRIKNNRKVRIAPCTFEGQILGEWIQVEPYFIKKDEQERILDLFRSKYGIKILFTSIMSKLRWKRYTIIRLEPKI